MTPDWIQVYPNLKFHALDPRVDEVNLLSIAHALGLQCRYAGHIDRFYSVAQHCILVSQFCDPQDALWGLLHDASEAYLVDVPSPIKRDPRFSFYREAEERVMNVICDWAGLPRTMPDSVKRADHEVLCMEAENFLPEIVDNWTGTRKLGITIKPLTPVNAAMEYTLRFMELKHAYDVR